MFTVAPRSGPAPPRSRTPPPPSGSSRPRHSAAATRRWRRGVGLPPPRLLFLYSPLPLPLRRRGSGKGAKPQCGLVAMAFQRSAFPLLLNPGAARGRAKSRCCPGLGCPGARGGAARSLSTPPRHRVTTRGKWVLSSPRPGSIRARAPWPSACVPRGDPAVPRPASWCGETGGARGGGSVTHRRVGEGIRVRLFCGVHAPVTDGEGRSGAG
jgi:hypothetical protein